MASQPCSSPFQWPKTPSSVEFTKCSSVGMTMSSPFGTLFSIRALRQDSLWEVSLGRLSFLREGGDVWSLYKHSLLVLPSLLCSRACPWYALEGSCKGPWPAQLIWSWAKLWVRQSPSSLPGSTALWQTSLSTSAFWFHSLADCSFLKTSQSMQRMKCGSLSQSCQLLWALLLWCWQLPSTQKSRLHGA